MGYLVESTFQEHFHQAILEELPRTLASSMKVMSLKQFQAEAYSSHRNVCGTLKYLLLGIMNIEQAKKRISRLQLTVSSCLVYILSMLSDVSDFSADQ